MTGRVLHLLSQRPGWTGSGVALDAIVRAASNAGWKQRVVVGTPADEPVPMVGELEDSEVLPLVFDNELLPFALPGMSDVMPYRSSRFSEMTPSELSAYREAWRRHVQEAINEFQPDVIHSHHIWLLSALVKDMAGDIPVVTHCHGTGFRQLSLCPHLAEEVCTGCRRNDRFLALHHGHADVLENEVGISREKIHVIGSGFRPEIFHSNGRSDSNGQVITYAGKLSNAKGLPWLLDAVYRLEKRRPDLVLHVAGSGSGDEADAIRERIQNMDNVEFHGQLDQQSLAELLRRSTLFVLPSFYEGLPLVLVEAAACGCRLVTTSLPGVVVQLAPKLGDAIEIVALPRMKNTDQPVFDDLPEFVENLVQAIDLSLGRPPLENATTLVAGMTWDGVFDHVETIWSEVSNR